MGLNPRWVELGLGVQGPSAKSWTWTERNNKKSSPNCSLDGHEVVNDMQIKIITTTYVWIGFDFYGLSLKYKIT